MKTLLEKAQKREIQKKKPTTENVTDQQIELAVAWLNDEISLAAVRYALGDTAGGSNTYSILARYLRAGRRRKLL